MDHMWTRVADDLAARVTGPGALLALLHNTMQGYRAVRFRRECQRKSGRTTPDTWLTVTVHCDTTFRIGLCGPT
jgi:hypothetical protein